MIDKFKVGKLYDIEGNVYKYLGSFDDEFTIDNLVFIPTTDNHKNTFRVKYCSAKEEKILIKKFNLNKEDRIRVFQYNKHIIKEIEDK